MAEEGKAELIMVQENKKVIEEVMDFLETLDWHEKKEFLALIQGAKFVKNLEMASHEKECLEVTQEKNGQMKMVI